MFRRLGSSNEGLSSAKVAQLRRTYGKNEILEHARLSKLRTLWNQIRSPLLFLLLFAAAVSAATGEWTDAIIVLTIVIASVGIGYRREYSAQAAAAALRARIKTRSTVVRDGRPATGAGPAACS